MIEDVDIHECAGTKESRVLIYFYEFDYTWRLEILGSRRAGNLVIKTCPFCEVKLLQRDTPPVQVFEVPPEQTQAWHSSFGSGPGNHGGWSCGMEFDENGETPVCKHGFKFVKRKTKEGNT